MTTYQLLVPSDVALDIVEDWDNNDLTCDLTIRRAKTRGCVVIETTDVLFANKIQRWHRCQGVHIKKK